VGRVDDVQAALVTLLRRGYGTTPLHLVAHVAALALAGYALLQILDARSALSIVVWLVGAVVLHDFVLLPLYSGLDRAARRVAPARAIAYLRVPAGLSALLLLVYFPLILGRGEGTFRTLSGLEPQGYLERWLLVTAVLFAASAALFVITSRKAP
jgi:hypothetical protein